MKSKSKKLLKKKRKKRVPKCKHKWTLKKDIIGNPYLICTECPSRRTILWDRMW